MTGIFLVITCAFTPLAMDALIAAGAKKSAALTQANEPDWKGIPGSHDLGIYWNQFFYNCTNVKDVIYKNVKPDFMEFGPYIYRESDTYSDLDYRNLDNLISESELPSVFNKFSQGTTFDSDGDGFLDTPMYLTN